MAIGGDAMNVAPRLNYHSLRSQKARFSVRFGKAWHLLTGVLSCGLLLLGGLVAIYAWRSRLAVNRLERPAYYAGNLVGKRFENS